MSYILTPEVSLTGTKTEPSFHLNISFYHQLLTLTRKLTALPEHKLILNVDSQSIFFKIMSQIQYDIIYILSNLNSRFLLPALIFAFSDAVGPRGTGTPSLWL